MELPGWLYSSQLFIVWQENTCTCTCTCLYDKHCKYWCEYAMHGPRPTLDHCSLSRTRQTRRGYPCLVCETVFLCSQDALCTVLNLVCQLFVARWCLPLRRRRGSRTLSTSNILPPYIVPIPFFPYISYTYPYPSSHTYPTSIYSSFTSCLPFHSTFRIEETTS